MLARTLVKKSVDAWLDSVAESEDATMASALPLFFNHKGKPYSLDWSHYFFEPMFRFKNRPRRMVYLCGRQVAKSSSAAHAETILAASIPNFSILNCLPFYEQARKFSANVVAPAIRNFTFNDVFLRSGGSVLQRDCANDSHLFFASMQGSADRVRGVSADFVIFDELQDIDPVNIPVALNCYAASPYKLETYLGTPKTRDNYIQERFDLSSQAAWVTPCEHCNFENYANTSMHLLKMIDGPTLVCANEKCRRPLNTRLGFWEHRFSDRRRVFAGYHVPQPVLPMHYEDPNAWQIIQEAKLGPPHGLPIYRFYNEILGESYDSGAKLITLEEIQAAAVVKPRPPTTTGRDGSFVISGVGADWGGRGKEQTTDTEEFISNTAVAIGGMRSDGVIEICHLAKIPYSINHHEEVDLVAQAASMSISDLLAIDYGGQGNVMQSMLEGKGCPPELIVPFTYIGYAPKRPLIQYTSSQHQGARSSYTLDKTRSLLLLIELIKCGQVLLPEYATYRLCLDDFMSIYEESVDSPTGSKTRRVCRVRRRTDDVVHAINFLVMALYHKANRWPALADVFAGTN